MSLASLRLTKIANSQGEKNSSKENFSDIIKKDQIQQNPNFNKFFKNRFSLEQEKQDLFGHLEISRPQSQNFISLGGSHLHFSKSMCTTETNYEENDSFFVKSPHMFLPHYRVNNKRSVVSSKNFRSKSLLMTPINQPSKF